MKFSFSQIGPLLSSVSLCPSLFLCPRLIVKASHRVLDFTVVSVISVTIPALLIELLIFQILKYQGKKTLQCDSVHGKTSHYDSCANVIHYFAPLTFNYQKRAVTAAMTAYIGKVTADYREEVHPSAAKYTEIIEVQVSIAGTHRR